MLYDASVQYLLVWRSGDANKLYWGLDNADSNMLLIASVKANLTEFPAGCAFEVCKIGSSAKRSSLSSDYSVGEHV